MSKREQMEANLIRLQKLGFSKYGAKAYLALVRLGSGTASEIAKASEIPQAKIYGVLEDLYEQGFIEKVEDASPACFKVDKPKERFVKFLSNFTDLADYLEEIHNSSTVSSKYGFYTIGNFTDKLQATDFLYIFDMSEDLYKRFFERNIHNYFRVGGPTNSLLAVGEKNTILLIEKENRVQYISIEDQIFTRMIDTVLALSPSNRHITDEMLEMSKGEPILYIDSLISSSGFVFGQHGSVWVTPTRLFLKIPGKAVYARPMSSIETLNATEDGVIELIIVRLDGEREVSELYTLSDPKLLENLIAFIKNHPK
ncbi:MAG: TrmB family transcriptional regulator [Candidatus Heimdallarchaeaceae archaeon]